MRLTSDVLLNAHARLNPCSERELDLRGLKIPAIENIGVTQDLYDTLDFTDNEIKKLENFPNTKRLSCLLLSNNHVKIINPEISEKIPSLRTLVLTNNKITNLSEVDNLAACANLTELSLLSNPVIRRQHYRFYVISKLPQLKVLDFSKIKPKERQEAERLFRSAAGKLMQEDVLKSKEIETDEAETATHNMAQLSEADRAQVRAAIAAASTPQEIDRIERQLKAGILPTVKNALPAATPNQNGMDIDQAVAPPPAVAPPSVVPHTPAAAPPPAVAQPAVAPAVVPAPAAPVPAPIVAPPPTAVPPPAVAISPAVVPTPAVTDPPSADMVVESSVETVDASPVPTPANESPSKESPPPEVEQPAPTTSTTDDMETDENEETLTSAEVGRMKVTELKAELKKRDLSASGLKKDLVKRLLEYL